MSPFALQILFVGALSFAAAPAAAQSATKPASLVPAAGDPLFAALGGQEGIGRIVADFVPRMAADPRIGRFFERTDLVELRKQLAAQFCTVAGGPCVYEGADMKKAHADMAISKAAFNRSVELLQLAMEDQGIAFADQNRLLARLAPMHRDIVAAP